MVIELENKNQKRSLNIVCLLHLCLEPCTMKEAKNSVDGYTSHSSLESSDNNNSNRENSDTEFECDLWANINEKMDDRHSI